MEVNTGGAQDQTSSNSGGAADGQNGGTTQSQQDSRIIKPEDHERALNDMMKFKKAVGEKDQKIQDLEKQFKEFQKKQMESGQDFKGLWELERTQKEEALAAKQEAEERAEKLKGMVAYNEKLKAVQKGLLDSGFRKEALSILDSEALDNVELEITSKGNFNVHGIDTFVDAYKKKYNFLFGNSQQTVVNSGGGTTIADEKPLTHEYMVQLSRSRKPEDQTLLKQLWPKYVQQQKQTAGTKK